MTCSAVTAHGMEDGGDGVENGLTTLSMADGPDAATINNQINGDPNISGYSSESDALVIDEGVQRQHNHRKSVDNDTPIHYNPYFNESLYELTQQHRTETRKAKGKNKPRLREYAQYLGLQPSVQFKCSKCGCAGFDTLITLNEHITSCNGENLTNHDLQQQQQQQQSCDNTCQTLKLTRKVFLCSPCGTYYENWNLYLHMLEVHRRYVCLYCLGMFSQSHDLCQHIQNRHQLEPGYRNDPEDFFNTYREPCYLLCCDCNRLFNEQDNFFYHNCTKKSNNKTNKKSLTKQQIRPEDHVTGDSLLSQVQSTPTVDEDDTESARVDSANVTSLSKDRRYESSDSEPDFKGFDDRNRGEMMTNTDNEMRDNYDDTMELEGGDDEEDDDDEDVNDNEEMEKTDEPIETRKVPKLSLKLKPGSFPEIENPPTLNSDEDDVNDVDDEQKPDDAVESDVNEQDEKSENVIQIAGSDIAIVELELEQPLDKFDIRILLQKCLRSTAATCIYCNHARKIAVNGKQLGLHAIAEHRFSAIVHSITAEELIPESFVTRIRESLSDLENVFFNLETNDEAVTFSHVFECFQCRYSTNIHKELYLHNRKLHTKNLLLCIMCKLNFYSYSELICHLCPGVYILDYDVNFRCCLCVNDDLPSAFRLMVHLRKRHCVCDVCLEMCHTQYKLSNHVWKHKLHHFCYRCGIAYRNKPDITRHLFWKHGTESVLCKKCLQKKWPHVYHFCVPPTSFLCDECNLTFTKAVALKVHKRIHTDIRPHCCTVENCSECFISKKLLEKHEIKQHRAAPEEQSIDPEIKGETNETTEEDVMEKVEDVKTEEKVEEKIVKPKVDVYDLPELNLSESDSESEDDVKTNEPSENNPVATAEEKVNTENDNTDPIVNDDQKIIEHIWDDFKNYQASKEKFDNLLNEVDKENHPESAKTVEENVILTVELALRDHDYAIDPENDQPKDVSFTEITPELNQSVDHDYCSPKVTNEEREKEQIADKIVSNTKDSSDSGSDSDSSCSCGSKCSCSSSSGTTTSTSDSSDSDSSTEEGRRRQQARREKRRKARAETKNNEEKVQETAPSGPPIPPVQITPSVDAPIAESDLETTESETDEEFYDKQPQKIAKKYLEEKRLQLLAGMEMVTNGMMENSNSRPATPLIDEPTKPKKKSKSKKKKKKKSKKYDNETFYHQFYQPPPPPTPVIMSTPLTTEPAMVPSSDFIQNRRESDSSLRASKRRRVPNKFYGYSSDEEQERTVPSPKWRKTDVANSSTMPLVPPITIRNSTIQQPVQRVPPFHIRTGAIKPKMPIKKVFEDGESGSESNDSTPETRNIPGVNPDALYCYCKCPYDEVSEMIGCDARDCAIEWFHFECVGIMVPPKGHWYCPECRKKRQQKNELLKLKTTKTSL